MRKAWRWSAWLAALLLACLAGACVAGACFAQQAEQGNAAADALLIGPGDLLDIRIFEEPQLSQRVRVDLGGQVILAMLGEMKVGGLSPSSAAQAIAAGYLSANLLKRPQVSVLVVEFATQGTPVLGQVAHPGTLMLYAPRSLTDVLSMAGGLTEVADRHIAIQRRGDAGETVVVFLPNEARAAAEQGRMLVNPGDTVVVAKAGIVYVLGDVGRPGGYVMHNESAMTLLQAIAAASGANRTAAESRVRIIRSRPGNAYEEKTVHLGDIQKGKAADLPLLANDVVYVPFSMARHVVLGAPAILSSTGAAAIYAHP